MQQKLYDIKRKIDAVISAILLASIFLGFGVAFYDAANQPEISEPAAETVQLAECEMLYYASVNSKVFHRKDCYYVYNIRDWNLIGFETREEADKTRRPCSYCNP